MSKSGLINFHLKMTEKQKKALSEYATQREETETEVLRNMIKALPTYALPEKPSENLKLPTPVRQLLDDHHQHLIDAGVSPELLSELTLGNPK